MEIFQLVSANRPAEAGEVITVFGTGIGGLTNAPATGAAASSSPTAVSRIPCTITIGGVEAEVLFAGLAPDNMGLAQWDVRVPSSLPAGRTPLIIRFGNIASKQVLLSVR
jgi:uncharacterized protein (TIGR03437 family)